MEARGCGQREDGDARDGQELDGRRDTVSTQHAERITNESNFINLFLMENRLIVHYSSAKRSSS